MIHGLPDKEEVLANVLPSPSNSHWFPWVQKQLTMRDMLCQTLEMPRSYDPIYQQHERVLNQMEISNETILVGHSCGGGFLLRYFSEHKELDPKRIILVAPWLDLEGYLKELDPQSDYFNFSIDRNLANKTELVCMYSTDDDKGIIDSVNMIEQEIPDTKMIMFNDKGHFTESSLKSKEFPELLDVIIK